MIEELIYTSAPKGLQTGKSGYCTVASTQGMAANLASLLESLSGYRHIFPATNAESTRNPVAYSHLLTKVGGKQYSVVSRVSDAGLDYSNRSNKLAHHLAISDPQSLSCGLAGLLAIPNLLISRWNSAPALLPPRNLKPEIVGAGVCNTWKSITGDAGWAGDVVEAIQQKRISYIIIDDQMPGLDLVLEILALLPASNQWSVTFSTYFTKVPPNVECNLRFVLKDSPEAIAARRNPAYLVLDLTSPIGTSKSRLAENARRGLVVAQVTKPMFKPASEMLTDILLPTRVFESPESRNEEFSDKLSTPPDRPLPARSSHPPANRFDTPTEFPVEKTTSLKWLILISPSILILTIVAILAVYRYLDSSGGIASRPKQESSSVLEQTANAEPTEAISHNKANDQVSTQTPSGPSVPIAEELMELLENWSTKMTNLSKFLTNLSKFLTNLSKFCLKEFDHVVNFWKATFDRFQIAKCGIKFDQDSLSRITADIDSANIATVNVPDSRFNSAKLTLIDKQSHNPCETFEILKSEKVNGWQLKVKNANDEDGLGTFRFDAKSFSLLFIPNKNYSSLGDSLEERLADFSKCLLVVDIEGDSKIKLLLKPRDRFLYSAVLDEVKASLQITEFHMVQGPAGSQPDFTRFRSITCEKSTPDIGKINPSEITVDFDLKPKGDLVNLANDFPKIRLRVGPFDGKSMEYGWRINDMKIQDCTVEFDPIILKNRSNFKNMFRTRIVKKLEEFIETIPKSSGIENEYMLKKSQYDNQKARFQTSLESVNWNDFGFPERLDSPIFIDLEDADVFLFVSFSKKSSVKWKDEDIKIYFDNSKTPPAKNGKHPALQGSNPLNNGSIEQRP